MGSAEKPAICQDALLRVCHVALAGADIRPKDFRQSDARDGDFVYFDPPYHPLDGGSFTDYDRHGFGESEQTALRDLCLELHRLGAKVMLSNSDTALIHSLYSKPAFEIKVVQAPRMVNRNASGRGAIDELLITNF